ncbi:hypothetical protein DB32_007639 [Sandaracinus amylolyticus]|uniref:Uncharacterized protein n=2 Tax=Sandaracinus amylolyticus TaxID=927083 RepID=A0A0F6W946_9BACT|nr:hypothetical protein DB32_007639 [Sandaracinus amylolyticus]
MPAEPDATDAELRRWQDTIQRIPEPVSLQEARALSASFGPDDCFGLAWALLHKIETCGMQVVVDEPEPSDEWRHRLWRRWQNQLGIP